MMTMTMYLADSSAWIDYLRDSSSPPLREFINDSDVTHTEPDAMELLSGTRDQTELHRVARMLQGTTLVPFDSASDFAAAAELRRRSLRQRLRVGVVDCMIVAVASRYDVPLITKDRPQAELARSLGLRVELLLQEN